MDVSLEKKLERLRLTGIKSTYQERIKSAQEEGWAYSALLDMLLTDEMDRRDQTQMVRRLAKSGLDMNRTMDSYDFKFNPKLQASSFSNPLIGSAAMDRLVHKGIELIIDGASYRTAQFKKKAVAKGCKI